MIAIYSQGEGRDLVMLSGWGMHRAMWGDLPERLARQARVHVCEMPGYADNPANEIANIDHLVRHLAAASAEKVDVLGWSLGAMYALKWAELYPEQVERLILLAATPSFVIRSDWPHGTSPAVLRNFALGLRSDPEALMNNFLQLLGTGEHNGHARALYSKLSSASEAALAGGLKQLRDLDLRSAVSELRSSALLLHGEDDVVTPVGASVWMAERLADASMRRYSACGHAPHLTRVEQVEADIESFLYGR